MGYGPKVKIFRSLDLNESEEQVKGSAGRLWGYDLVIPTMGDTNGSGRTEMYGAPGISFESGITVAVTTGLADDDTGAPGDNEAVVHIFYK